MGIQELGSSRSFKVVITNVRLHSMWFAVSVEDCEAVRVTTKNDPLRKLYFLHIYIHEYMCLENNDSE
jgi:hypothetical protein